MESARDEATGRDNDAVRRPRRRVKRRRVRLVLGAVALCIGGALLAIALTHGTDGLVRIFTTPWLEAKSGRRYTPTGAAKRYIEKLSEKEAEQ